MSVEQQLELSDFIKKMVSLGGDVEAAVVRGLQASADRFQARVVHEIQHTSPHPAVDRGELVNSVETQLTFLGARVVVLAPHARYINDGTRPFRPPYKVILDWLIRKKLVDEDDAPRRAWAIVNAIATRGIAPRHFMNRAWAWFNAGKYVGREVGRELEALAQARGKGRPSQATRRGTGLGKKKGG